MVIIWCQLIPIHNYSPINQINQHKENQIIFSGKWFLKMVDFPYPLDHWCWRERHPWTSRPATATARCFCASSSHVLDGCEGASCVELHALFDSMGNWRDDSVCAQVITSAYIYIYNVYIYNVLNPIINLPFGNLFDHLFMLILGVHIIYLHNLTYHWGNPREAQKKPLTGEL